MGRIRRQAQEKKQLDIGKAVSKIALPAVGFVVIVFAVYFPAVNAGYIWDDDAYVQNNRTLRSLEGLGQIWFKIGATPQYYPLVHTSYWLEFRLWRLNPAGYHIVNILLHALGAVLLWRLLKLLQLPGAWIAALIFALHPVHVESVAWITERKNVLSGVFYLGSALCYLRYALCGRGVRFYVLSLLLFICALLSKTVTASLPAALLLVLWWKRRGISFADVGRLTPFFLIGAAFGILTVFMEKYRVGAVGVEWDFSFMERCLIAGRAICFYASKLFWPWRLTFIYPRWDIDVAVWWQYLFGVVVVAGVSALWLGRSRIGTAPLVAVLFFVGTLFPALGFFNVYPMRYSFVADHFQYLASIGLIILITAVAASQSERLPAAAKRLVQAVAICIFVTFGALTWQQCHIYKDIETLWLDTLRKNPEAEMAHTNLGIVLASQGRYDQAISHYQKAMELLEDNAEAHNNMGIALERQGKLKQAHGHYRRALEIMPDYADAHFNLGGSLAAQGSFDEAVKHFYRAVEAAPGHAEAHNSLGLVLKLKGRVDDAIGHYRRAVEINPDYAEAHNNLGAALAAQGRLNEAIDHFHRVLLTMPDDAEGHYNLALALKLNGKTVEALEHFRRAVKARPYYLSALNEAARILATHPDSSVRDASEAVVFAERAAKLTNYKNVTVLEILATAYAAAGRFKQAAGTIETALELAGASGNDGLVNRLQKQRDSYRQPSR